MFHIFFWVKSNKNPELPILHAPSRCCAGAGGAAGACGAACGVSEKTSLRWHKNSVAITELLLVTIVYPFLIMTPMALTNRLSSNHGAHITIWPTNNIRILAMIGTNKTRPFSTWGYYSYTVIPINTRGWVKHYRGSGETVSSWSFHHPFWRLTIELLPFPTYTGLWSWLKKTSWKYESQWEGLSHILWKIKHVWTTNQLTISHQIIGGADPE